MGDFRANLKRSWTILRVILGGLKQSRAILDDLGVILGRNKQSRVIQDNPGGISGQFEAILDDFEGDPGRFEAIQGDPGRFGVDSRAIAGNLKRLQAILAIQGEIQDDSK